MKRQADFERGGENLVAGVSQVRGNDGVLGEAVSSRAWRGGIEPCLARRYRALSSHQGVRDRFSALAVSRTGGTGCQYGTRRVRKYLIERERERKREREREREREKQFVCFSEKLKETVSSFSTLPYRKLLNEAFSEIFDREMRRNMLSEYI